MSLSIAGRVGVPFWSLEACTLRCLGMQDVNGRRTGLLGPVSSADFIMPSTLGTNVRSGQKEIVTTSLHAFSTPQMTAYVPVVMFPCCISDSADYSQCYMLGDPVWRTINPPYIGRWDTQPDPAPDSLLPSLSLNSSLHTLSGPHSAKEPLDALLGLRALRSGQLGHFDHAAAQPLPAQLPRSHPARRRHTRPALQAWQLLALPQRSTQSSVAARHLLLLKP